MELKMKNGDYLPDGIGGEQRVDGTEALLARALFRLSVRRGSFPFLPELGSELYRLGHEKPSARAAATLARTHSSCWAWANSSSASLCSNSVLAGVPWGQMRGRLSASSRRKLAFS